jgi:transcriptional regulator with XRE-family HTH domain
MSIKDKNNDPVKNEANLQNHLRSEIARARKNLMADIDWVRQSQGLSLNEVSRRSGVDRKLVSKMLSGKGDPYVTDLQKVCEAIGLHIDWTKEGESVTSDTKQDEVTDN